MRYIPQIKIKEYQMEQHFNNVVNFGIGCWSTLSERYREISERIRSGVGKLTADGKKPKNSAAVKNRKVAAKTTEILRRGEKIQKNTRAA
jgi:hypothetical protein